MAATPWRVRVVAPRKGRGEACLYLRARRRADGRREERRLSSNTSDRGEAEELARAWEQDLNGTAPREVETLLDVMDARLRDLEADPSKSPHSVVGLRSARKRMAEALGELAVARVDRTALLRARDAMVAKGHRPRTINTTFGLAASAWRWCEERGLVARAWPKLRPLKKGPDRKRPYTDSEVEAVLEWLRSYRGGKWFPLVSLAADTGRRISEVCQVQGRDVDYAARTLRIRLKGGEEVAVPISERTFAVLPRVGADEWLFRRRLRTGGYGPASRHSVLGAVRKAVAGVGIPDGERVDVHSFRRYACGALIRSGVPLPVAMRITGHRTAAMFLHYQRQWVGDDLREAVEAVQARRGGSEPARDSLPQPSAGDDLREAVEAVQARRGRSEAAPDPLQRPSAGDDLLEALEALLAQRGDGDGELSEPPPGPPPRGEDPAGVASPPHDGSPGNAGASEWGYQDSNLGPHRYQRCALTS